MRKVEISKAAVMTRAWEIRKSSTDGMTMSEALKQAWKEAKEAMEEKTVEETMVEIMENLVDMATRVYDYKIVVKEWNNYGKSRTYLSIIETYKNSRHYKKYDCGYIDNKTNTYVPGKKDLNKRYTLAGSGY